MRKVLVVLLAMSGFALLAGPAAATIHTQSFHTPSGKILCVLYSKSAGLRCDVRDATYKVPPPPKSCMFDTGPLGVRYDSKRGFLRCVSDAVDKTRTVLGYGHRWSRGGVACVSRRTGLTCKNAKGHGFFASRQRYRLF